MNPAQLHLALNHFPIIGLLLVLMIFAYGLSTKSEAIQRISLIAMIFVALITVPVFFSGEPAEEIIEETTSVSDDIIHEHEEAAELAFIIMEIFGVIAVAGLFLMRKNKLSSTLKYVILISGIIIFILFVNVGRLGGKIMHPETDFNANEQVED